MTTRPNRRAVPRLRAVLAVVMLTLLVGCDSFVEPTKFTTIEDAKAFTTTRSDVNTIFDTAAATAIAAVHGGEIQNGDRVIDVTCGEPYSKAFRELQIRGFFVVEGLSGEAVIDGVRRAWAKQGWKVKVTDEARIFFETTTSTGVRVIGSAPTQVGADSPNVGVGLSVGTGCLKLPQSAVDDL